MASNNWSNGKVKGATEAKAKFGHTTKDERQRRKHSNPHIDVSRTHLNKSIHEMLTGHEYTYSEMCDVYDSKIEELDAIPGQNKRKDRVTLQCIETPAPADLPEDKMDEWFLKVAMIEMQLLGEDNFIDGHIDKDETHEYVDPKTNETVMSRNHMVSYFVPVVEDKNGVPKLNGKAFSARKNMTKLNNAVEEMTVRDYGVHFMTGAKTKSKQSMQQLKDASEAAALEKAAEQLEANALAIEQGIKAAQGVAAAKGMLETITEKVKEEETRSAELAKQNTNANVVLSNTQKAIKQEQGTLQTLQQQKQDLEGDIGELKNEYALLKAQPPKQKVVEVEKVVYRDEIRVHDIRLEDAIIGVYDGITDFFRAMAKTSKDPKVKTIADTFEGARDSLTGNRQAVSGETLMQRCMRYVRQRVLGEKMPNKPRNVDMGVQRDSTKHYDGLG